MQLEYRNLSKAFGDTQVLDGVSLTLRPGVCTCLTGPSGCGKTTLLRLICGLLRPDGGELPENVKYSIAFQEDRLLPGKTAVDNLRFVLRGRRSEEELTSILSELLPEDSLSLPVEQCSGGMRRRIAIARALAADSDCVLLDEPFNGLDGTAEQAAADFIFKHLRGRCLLVITHHPEAFRDRPFALIELPKRSSFLQE